MAGYYHLTVNIISRGNGRSAVACAAYRSGQKLLDKRYGTCHDYERKHGILKSGISSPEHVPDWAKQRESLWNEVEQFERRKDAQLAREFVVGLPSQLTSDQQHELLDGFIRDQFTSKGYVVDWAIHEPNREGDERNFHSHVMVSMRTVDEDGFSTLKDRTLNKPEQLQEWRKAWSDAMNRAFEKHDILDDEGRILHTDHRSYADQGEEMEPTTHMGVHATAMERRGLVTDVGDFNREIEERNEAVKANRRVASRRTRNEIQSELDADKLEEAKRLLEPPTRKRTGEPDSHTLEL